jgi:hypothetical protein
MERVMKPVLLAAMAALSLAALSLAPSSALAKDLPDGGMTLEEVAAWMKGEGLPAEIKTGKDGAQTVASSLGGANFQVYPYDCKGGRCGSIQFAAGFDTKGAYGPAPINDWNRDNRWTRAYSDKVNDPWLEMDFDLTPGGTYELLDDELAIWRSAIERFRKFIKW